VSGGGSYLFQSLALLVEGDEIQHTFSRKREVGDVYENWNQFYEFVKVEYLLHSSPFQITTEASTGITLVGGFDARLLLHTTVITDLQL
jgi:hypothetical protein